MTGGERRRHRPPRENALLALLRIPVFRRVWAAIAFSSLGDWLGLLANTALAQQLTREQSLSTQGAAISGVILVRLAPDLLFGPFAAALSDKLDRRKTVIVGDLFVGVLYASIAFGYNLLWLYVAQFVIEATGLFTQPCKQVIWVAIVPKRLLPTANQISLFSVYGTVPIAAGLFAVLSTVDRLVSGGGSGGVHVSIVVALLLNTVTFVVSATTIFLSRREIPVAPQAREQQEGIFGLLREGIAFVRHDPLIRGLYVGIIGAFAGGGLVVGVAQPWVLTLNAGTAGYSIMFGVVFTGLALGMLLGPRVLPSYRRNRVFGLAIGAAGLTLFGASVIRDFVLAVVLAAFVGFFSGMAWIIGYTLIGQEVEDRLRGRVFAFVLSSVRLILLLTIAVGPNLAGLFGTHAIRAGRDSYLILSGPGLTLLLGGVLALGVSFYATSRAGGQRRRLRDAVRRRLLKSTAGHRERPGLFVTVDGLDPAATARYAALVAEVARQRSLHVVETAEPTAPLGGDADADRDPAGGPWDVEPETAALLSAADRAEHVATRIRPALERGEFVVCDRFALTSLAVHGPGRGGDLDRIRSVNAWATGELTADLSLVVEAAGEAHGDLDLAAARHALEDEIDADPQRLVRCEDPSPAELPEEVLRRLERLVAGRRAEPGTPGPSATAPVEVAAPPVATDGSPPAAPGDDGNGRTAAPSEREDATR